jgi:CubicO group peptidase (beta-lactamase class C family)
MTRRLSRLLACALVALVGAASSGDQLDDRLALFGRYLAALQRQTGIPGLSAVILVDRRPVWEVGLGRQSIEGGVPATPDTPYSIASITKTFTSTLLLGCVEHGTLNLDEPIRRYSTLVPEPGATVRHVLTHTSEGVPGQSFRYNGDRFAALTPVVESCWGAPFRVVLAREILSRLAMQSSVPGHDLEQPDAATAELFDRDVLARYQRVLLTIARPYAVDSRGRASPSAFPPRGINASAGLISTARDLAQYDRAIDDHVLLRPETQELAWTPATTTSGQRIPYGLGWFTERVSGDRVVWHYGLWGNAFSSLILKVPDRGLTLILLANSDGLSSRVPLAAGEVRASPFAEAFLTIMRGAL